MWHGHLAHDVSLFTGHASGMVPRAASTGIVARPACSFARERLNNSASSRLWDHAFGVALSALPAPGRQGVAFAAKNPTGISPSRTGRNGPRSPSANILWHKMAVKRKARREVIPHLLAAKIFLSGNPTAFDVAPACLSSAAGRSPVERHGQDAHATARRDEALFLFPSAPLRLCVTSPFPSPLP